MSRAPRVSPDFNMDPDQRKKYMRVIYGIISILYDFFQDEEKCIVWLDTPNMNFGGSRPVDLINSGRAAKVALWLKAAKEENKPPKVATH